MLHSLEKMWYYLGHKTLIVAFGGRKIEMTMPEADVWEVLDTRQAGESLKEKSSDSQYV